MIIWSKRKYERNNTRKTTQSAEICEYLEEKKWKLKKSRPVHITMQILYPQMSKNQKW
jgi:hypothetical protein